MAKIIYTIFLASSNELEADRVAFRAIVQEQNDSLVLQGKNVQFTVPVWESKSESFIDGRKQAEYNDAIENCDIFIMLYWSKVGKYTEEEFDIAYSRLKNSQHVRVFVYKENADAPPGQTDADKESLRAFEDKVLLIHKQFRGNYNDNKDLKAIFFNEINKLFNEGFLLPGEPAITLYSSGNSVPQLFLGREEELRTIREKLDEGGKLMLINAEGGIGKTTLAAKYWQESLYDYKYNAWLFCENGIITELKKLAPDLNIDLSGMDEAQQVEALRKGLINVSHDFLLVLDNANDPKGIESFKQSFRGFHWHVLITSRCSGVLEPGQEYPITHLPPPLAKELFGSNYKEETSEFEELLDRLLEAVKYHTLLVELFSKNMRELKKRGENLSDFLKQLEITGLFLEKRSFKIITDYTHSVHKESENSDEIIAKLYDFSRLPETERYYLVNMALLPAINYEFVFLCDLFQQDKFEFTSLDYLVRHGWLTTDGESYRLSQVIQQLVLIKNKETLGADSEALLNNLKWKLENDGSNFTRIHLKEVKSVAQLAPSITKHLILYPSYELCVLNFNSGLYFENTGDLIAAKHAYESFEKISREIIDLTNLAFSYSKLGGIFEAIGDWKKALDNYQKANKFNKAFLENSPQNLNCKSRLANSYLKLGSIYEVAGDWKNASTNYHEPLRIFKEICDSNPENLEYKKGLAISYGKLGQIYEVISDWENALSNHQEDFKITKNIYDNSPENFEDKKNLATSYLRLGSIYQEMKDWKNALENFLESNRISKEIYELIPENLNYKNLLAISYSRLGTFYQEIRDWNNSLVNFQEQLKICKELHQSSPDNLEYKKGLAICYCSLGHYWHFQKDPQKAATQFSEGRELFIELMTTTGRQVAEIVYFFSGTSYHLSEIIKWIITNDYYQGADKPDVIHMIKTMRKEGFENILFLGDHGKLKQGQRWLLDELGKEDWYEF